METQFDQVAETYDEGLEALLRPYTKGADTSRFAEYKVQLVHDILKKKKIRAVLDFGCGTGRSLAYFEKYFYDAEHLYGCDVSAESIKIASKEVPRAQLFVNSSVEKFDQFFKGKGGYDLAFLACVLHHIEPQDRKDWMKAVVRNLKPGGCLAVFEHNLKNPYTKKIVSNPDNTVDDIHYMLTPKELCSLLLECGPKVSLVWKGYTMFSLFRPAWMTRAEQGLKWCPLGAQHCVIVQKR